MKKQILSLVILLSSAAAFAQVNCIAAFEFYPTNNLNEFHFVANQQLGEQNTYYWDFGDGTFNNENNIYPLHTFPESGFYPICLFVYHINPANGDTVCSDSYCDTIEVGGVIGDCDANFNFYQTGNTNEIQFASSQVGTQNAFHWMFGDGSGSTEANPVHTFPQEGPYNVCLVVYDIDSINEDTICISDHCMNITLGNPSVYCNAEFEHYNCNSALQYHFIANYQNNNQNVYHWDFGDGTTCNGNIDPVHTFPGNGAYEVCLSVYHVNPANNDTVCSDTYCEYIEINTGGGVNCIANYEYYNNDTTYHFIANTQLGNQNSYYWDFGDGFQESGNTDPIHIFQEDGVYETCLTVYHINPNSGDTICSDTYCEAIVVGNPAPNDTLEELLDTCIISFTIDSAYIYDVLTNNSNLVEVIWAIVQDSNIILLNSVYYCQNAGLYYITLTILCDDKAYSYTVEGTITVKESDLVAGIKNIKHAGDNILIYPNPVTDKLNVIINSGSNSKVNIKILNSVGQTIHNQCTAVNSGQNLINMNASDLKAGIYFIVFDINGRITTKKFIK